MYDDIGFPSQANVTVGLGFSGERLAEMNKGITPMFFIEPVENAAKTAEEGRPMFDEMECVRLFIAGDPLSQAVNPVDASIKARFPAEYKRWKEDHEDRHISGTPLRAWALLTPSQIKEFEAIGIFNVEGVASIADVNLSRSASLREWREKAIAYLAGAKDGAAITRYAEENLRLRDEIADLKDEMAKFADELKALQKKKAA